ncbi:MAG: DUF87 domain-containing protein, partial [Ruminococcus sp.]|nr:DUF87 domain-containing protein [Ruminococcus sp.]
MRLIPGKTKVRIELFKGVTLTDIIIGVVGLGLVALVLLSTIPGRIYFAIGVASVAILLIMRLDERSNYWLLIGFLKYLALPKRYRRMFSDDHLLTKNSESRRGEQWNKYFSEKISSGESMTQRMKEKKAEDEILESDADDEEKNAVWREREQRKLQYESESYRSEKDMEELSAFTGIGGGFIEYNGKYYGSVIEINPVEFRFFSTYRRNSSIETYFGKILRSLRDNYAANIVKIDRPIIYTKYLEREYQKLDSLIASYEQGLLTEEELKARVEIQYERIHAIRNICYDNKIVQPFYYLCLFNIDKKQLQSDTSAALTSLGQAELTVRRLTTDKELAVFLKDTNTLDFNEWEIDKIAPEDYVRWAMPETVTFTTRTAVVNKVVSHQMRVVGYPTVVGDSWLAGVMSIPSTKVVIKATPMERGKSIRAIDRSLQELRAQFNNTGIDSKRIELQTHIDTLSRLLVTLQQDNEALLTVNIYITMYDVIRTSEMGNDEVSKNSSLAPIADMKKTVRRAWSEAGMRLNGMDCSQTECYIGSQISAYDPYLNDGRGMPANTVAAMFPWIYARVSDEGGMWLGSNDGVPVFIDFFRRDSQRVNSNMVIIGKSGAGKSYGTKALLTNMASENAKIFILDPENEYSELAHNLHGKIIDVASAKYGRLNPFHIMTTLEDEDSSEDISIGYSAHLQFLEEFFR